MKNEKEIVHEQDTGALTRKLFSLLSQGRGMQALIDAGYEFLGNPILLFDLSHTLLCFTKNVTITDPVWNEITQKGYSSYGIVSQGEAAGLFRRIRTSYEPFINYSDISGNPILHCNISVEGRSVGYLVIVGAYRGFDPADLEYSTILSQAVSLELQKNPAYNITELQLHGLFLTDVLDGMITEPEIIKERLAYIKLDISQETVLILFCWDESEAGEKPTSELLNILNQKGWAFSYRNEILLLADTRAELMNPQRTWIQDIYENLTERFSFSSLRCGVSRPFSGLENLPKHYFQARQALEAGMKAGLDESIFFFDEYMEFSLFNNCKLVSELQHFCHPALVMLKEYDSANQSELLKSLYVYLSTDKNINKAADALFVHRNTLSRRLEKITDIIHIQSMDGNESFRLLLSYKILIFLGQFSPDLQAGGAGV